MMACKTTSRKACTWSTLTDKSPKEDPNSNQGTMVDSHRAAAFLLLQIKGMATDEHSKSGDQQKPHSIVEAGASTGMGKNGATGSGTLVSNPSTPLLTTRPLPQKPILPRVPSTNLLLPATQQPATTSQGSNVVTITTPATTALSASITPNDEAQQQQQQQQPALWLIPRRTVSLGSSNENLAGLLQDALKPQEDLQGKEDVAHVAGGDHGTESPITTERSVSWFSASTADSNQDSSSPPSNLTSFAPALVSPTAGVDSLKKQVSVNLNTTTFTEVPLFPAISFVTDASSGAAEATIKTVVIPTSPPLQGDTTTPSTPTCTTSPTLATTEATSTEAASSATTTTPALSGVLRRKFSWKSYPVLEQYLLDHRIEYLQYSAKLNYTAEQKRYNNKLTTNLIELAATHGYVFDKEHFSFAAIRDRIRCYYKSYVQAAKKKKRKQQQAANKNNNSNNSPKRRRKMVKAKAPPPSPPTSSQDELQVLHQQQPMVESV